MGGTFISVWDNDGASGHMNPSLLHRGMNHQLALNYINYLTDARMGYAGFVHHVEPWQTTCYAGVMYQDYGTFQHTDEYGNVLGTFEAAEYSITVGMARRFAGNFQYGLSLTGLQSRLESYTASGIAASLAGSYHDTARGLTTTVQFRNVGMLLDQYTSVRREPLPFDLQAGISQRLPHTPFLLSLVLHDLHRWNLRYDDETFNGAPVVVGDSVAESGWLNNAFDELLLHAIVGVEIHIADVIRFSVAYNGQRRKELAYEFLPRFSGFSYGIGVRISRLSFGYGRAVLNTAAAYHNFSLALNLSDFKKP